MTLKSMLSAGASAAETIDFDSAVEHYYQALYQFAFSLSGSASEAADLTQETYRVLLVKSGQIRETKKIKSWLFTTLYREFLKGRHHLSRFPEVELEEAVEELPTVSAGELERIDSHLVISALEDLDERYRAPVAMFYLEDLSYKEIAELLEMPIGTVMSRLSRGKLILRQKLAKIYATETTEPPSMIKNAPAQSRVAKTSKPPAREVRARPPGSALALP